MVGPGQESEREQGTLVVGDAFLTLDLASKQDLLLHQPFFGIGPVTLDAAHCFTLAEGRTRKSSLQKDETKERLSKQRFQEFQQCPELLEAKLEALPCLP